ncbi:kinase-like domain-containing protein [Leptodontidium sp. MPI-SDFR-AT-0119]|nr:kinase-like domain-containing protein [Leptodontidium sp. MPI-SDFR-AT-0119]
MSTIDIRAVREDGTVEDIPEEDLYRHTRHRWLYNEARNLSQRYLKFNLQGLIQVAVEEASREGAQHCTEVLKCKEGMNNRAYLFKMDNDSVVFAKLPNSIAGPPFYTTASEVATRTFLAEVLDIPTPRILAWSAQKANPVGAEYILEERASGQPLGALWQDWNKLPLVNRFGIIRQLVNMERKLAETTFQHCGSIYFKEDFPQGDDMKLSGTCTISPSTLGRYALGPMVGIDFWQGPKASMDLDRGPFNGPLEFLKGKAVSEMKFIQAHGRPWLNIARSLTELERPEEMVELLTKYLQLVPAMIPPSTTDDLHSSTLWHPDLHLDNLLFDNRTMKVTSVIDWQSTTAAPFFLQCGVPKLLVHPEPLSFDLTIPKRPENYMDLTQEEKEEADYRRGNEHLLKYYLRITKRDNPRHWTALQLHNEIRVQPARLVQHAWEQNIIFFLKVALMKIVNRWEHFCPDAGPCPVNFNEVEQGTFDFEAENREAIGSVLSLLQEKYGLHPEGNVVSARYDEMQMELMRLKTGFLSGAADEDERLLADKLWPYQDTMES